MIMCLVGVHSASGNVNRHSPPHPAPTYGVNSVKLGMWEFACNLSAFTCTSHKLGTVNENFRGKLSCWREECGASTTR
ncbi:hypothetical protein J6590_076372 [Homalodisca vitripennis]|nr:hypothetical protein J6590_076372 [Homalodisca vitripennis]